MCMSYWRRSVASLIMRAAPNISCSTRSPRSPLVLAMWTSEFSSWPHPYVAGTGVVAILLLDDGEAGFDAGEDAILDRFHL